MEPLYLMVDAGVIALMIPIIALSIPIVAIVAAHRQKIAELKLKMQQHADQSVVAELSELRRQITELRDTTTKYDLSFDAALQRMESRMSAVEQRMAQVEHASSSLTLS